MSIFLDYMCVYIYIVYCVYIYNICIYVYIKVSQSNTNRKKLKYLILTLLRKYLKSNICFVNCIFESCFERFFFLLGWKNLMTFGSFTYMVPNSHPHVCTLSRVKLYSTEFHKGEQGSQASRAGKPPAPKETGMCTLAESF